MGVGSMALVIIYRKMTGLKVTEPTGQRSVRVLLALVGSWLACAVIADLVGEAWFSIMARWWRRAGDSVRSTL